MNIYIYIYMAVYLLLYIFTTAPVLTTPGRLSTHLCKVAQTNFLKCCTIGHPHVHATKKRFLNSILFLQTSNKHWPRCLFCYRHHVHLDGSGEELWGALGAPPGSSGELRGALGSCKVDWGALGELWGALGSSRAPLGSSGQLWGPLGISGEL